MFLEGPAGGFFTLFIEQSQSPKDCLWIETTKRAFPKVSKRHLSCQSQKNIFPERFLSQDKNLAFFQFKEFTEVHVEHENSDDGERVDQVHLDNQFCGFAGTFIFDDFDDDVCYVIFPMWFSVF